MEPNYVTTLFLPTIASCGADEDVYTDLLTARLQIMMPLLPGMAVSLLEHPSDASADTPIPRQNMQVLSELLTAVGASFSRIYGQWNSSVNNRKQSSSAIVNQIIQSAKTFAPPLMVIIMLIENHIRLRTEADDKQLSEWLTLLQPELSKERSEKRNDADAQVSRIVRQLSSSALMNTYSHDEAEQKGEGPEKESMISHLQSCQKSVMSTLTDLIGVSMKLGGGEASTSLWRSILTTLKESVAYAANAPSKNSKEESIGELSEAPSKEEIRVEKKAHAESLSQNILSRVSAAVLMKCLRRDSQWELWTANLCAAVSKMCIMIEEKDLFMRLLGPLSDKFGEGTYSSDQVMLLGALLNVLEYGRDLTGWCQIVVPSIPNQNSGDSQRSLEYTWPNDSAEDGSPKKRSSVKDVFRSLTPARFKSNDQVGAAAKLLLQVLQPALRIVVGCVGNITTLTTVRIPPPPAFGDDAPAVDAASVRETLLLEYTLNELQATLTAAIVGLSFANARDVCMNALASMRRAVLRHQHRQDDLGVELCYKMLSAIAEEMRVRYIDERRKRDTALFDAYEENDAVKQKAEDAAESSRAVENLMLGGDLLGGSYQGLATTSTPEGSEQREETQEDGTQQDATEATPDAPAVLNKDKDSQKGKDDFVMFHDSYHAEGSNVDSQDASGKMGYAQYDGFALALENCSAVAKSIDETESAIAEVAEKGAEDSAAASASTNADKVIATLSPFLDKFDETVALEAAESEMVELFDTNFRLDSPSSGSMHPQLSIAGAETAADAMTSFIEFASVEKARLNEIAGSFLPGHRYSRLAYTHRICWSRYIELSEAEDDYSMDRFWERGINDGNRDVRSRLITMPVAPQFKRYIPKYLDHGPDCSDSASQMDFEASVAMHEESERPKQGKRAARTSIAFLAANRTTSSAKGRRRKTEFFSLDQLYGQDDDEDDEDEELELDMFTKTLSAATGGHIVDITKKAVVEDDDEPSVLNSGMDGSDREDDAYIAEADQNKKRRGSDNILGQSIRESEQSERPMKVMSMDAKEGAAHYNITSSAFASPPDNSSSSLSIMHSAAAALIEQYLDNCLHVKAEGSRQCTMLLTSMHLILEYGQDDDGHFDGEVLAEKEEEDRQKRLSEDAGVSTKDQEQDKKIAKQAQRSNREEAHLRPKSIRFNLSEVSHIYLRRYRLRDSSLEMFFIPSGGTAFGGYGMYSPLTSLFLDFGPGREGLARRDDAAFAIMRRTPPQTIKQWPDRSEQFLHEQLNRLTIGWAEGRITNFDQAEVTMIFVSTRSCHGFSLTTKTKKFLT